MQSNSRALRRGRSVIIKALDGSFYVRRLTKKKRVLNKYERQNIVKNDDNVLAQRGNPYVKPKQINL